MQRGIYCGAPGGISDEAGQGRPARKMWLLDGYQRNIRAGSGAEHTTNAHLNRQRVALEVIARHAQVDLVGSNHAWNEPAPIDDDRRLGIAWVPKEYRDRL